MGCGRGGAEASAADDRALKALRADASSQAESKAAMAALLKTFDTLQSEV